MVSLSTKITIIICLYICCLDRSMLVHFLLRFCAQKTSSYLLLHFLTPLVLIHPMTCLSQRCYFLILTLERFCTPYQFCLIHQRQGWQNHMSILFQGFWKKGKISLWLCKYEFWDYNESSSFRNRAFEATSSSDDELICEKHDNPEKKYNFQHFFDLRVKKSSILADFLLLWGHLVQYRLWWF